MSLYLKLSIGQNHMRASADWPTLGARLALTPPRASDIKERVGKEVHGSDSNSRKQ